MRCRAVSDAAAGTRGLGIVDGNLSKAHLIQFNTCENWMSDPEVRPCG